MDKLFTHVTLSLSSEFGTGQGAVMHCGWAGNCRSGVALAMRHRLQWSIHLRDHGLREGDEHPVWHSLPTLRDTVTNRHEPTSPDIVGRH